MTSGRAVLDARTTLKRHCCNAQNGLTALALASFYGHTDVVKLLLEAGAKSIDQADEVHAELFLRACCVCCRTLCNCIFAADAPV